MSGLVLGAVRFQAFEVPGKIRFGGEQQMHVHKLPGGGRVIDVMGRDDADIAWSGIMSGPTASNRARLLDAVRVAGQAVTLSWDAFAFTVILSSLTLDYENPWWIPYSLRCTVVADLAQAASATVTTALSAIQSDLSQVGQFVDVSGVTAAIASNGAFDSGTASAAAASQAFQSARSALDTNIAASGQALAVSDAVTLANAAGTLAELAAARGFLARAASNFGDAVG